MGGGECELGTTKMQNSCKVCDETFGSSTKKKKNTEYFASYFATLEAASLMKFFSIGDSTSLLSTCVPVPARSPLNLVSGTLQKT